MNSEPQTPQDDRLAAATSALRDRPAPALPPDAVVERALQIDASRGVFRWRLPSALAAVIAAAVGLAWVMLWPRGANVAFADVVQKLKQAHTSIITMTTSRLPSMRVVAKDKIVREEMQNSVTIFNGETGLTLNLFPSEHEAVLSRLPMDKMKLEAASLGGMIRDMIIGKEKLIGEKVIDGRRVVGFELPMSNAFPSLSGSTCVYWIDPETKLPVEMDMHQNGPPVLDVHETCQFDVPVDDALFTMTPPAGYHVRDMTVSAAATQPSVALTTQQSNDLTITPLVGIGPLQFGDKREKIVAMFGEPEKDVVPDLHLPENTLKFPQMMGFKMPEIHQLQFHSRGLILMYDSGAGLSCVMCLGKIRPDPTIAEYSAFTGKMDKGIGMGASRSQIEAIYGPASIMHDDPVQTMLKYPGLGLIFTLNNGRLDTISAFSTPLPSF